MVQLDQLLDSCVADLTEAERQLAEITAAATSVRSLIAQRPEIVNLSQTLTPTLDEDLAQAQGDIEDLRSRRRTAFDELAGVRERLASAESDRRIVEEVVDAFRKDALLEATEAAVGSFSSEVRAGIVTPLSQELGRQWKRFRPKAPWNLVIGQDGCLAIEMLGETRPHSVLSAGEKTVAIVLLKVALAVAFTSASFMVLDEPLEHLDPRTRRVLISSLQHAVEHHVVDQIIVSTYEEVIVRRLQQQGLAHAIYMD
jgi:DNA repair exonuclease SbcCD ATPase subunit